jgi:aspartate-semialdehyde dehydrogenase
LRNAARAAAIGTEIVMGYRVVVAGATGNVGREMVNILAEREFPLDEIAVLASSRSQGEQIEYGDTGKMLKVQNIEHFDPAGWDMARQRSTAIKCATSSPIRTARPRRWWSR